MVNGMNEESGQYEANGVAYKDQGYDRIANLVVALHVR